MRIFSILLGLLLLNAPHANAVDSNIKEWSFFLFLNGHNSLDSFGKQNILSMEKVGSSDQVNLVVQWASMNQNTKRLYIKKSNNPNSVSSPIVENLGVVDMGDYHNITEFVRWGIKHYPAKHYFVAVWDHGGGWHEVGGFHPQAKIHPQDISWDDRSGNNVTTKQLGLAMNDIAKILGRKIDIYGSDACLMAMPEVANEMRDSVNYFVGSEETEPGEGWPYETFLASWIHDAKITPENLSKSLSHEYVKAYSPGGVYSNHGVTMSVLDLTKIKAYNLAMKSFAKELKSNIGSRRQAILNAASSSQQYAYADYKDFLDFTQQLDAANILSNSPSLLKARNAAKSLVVANDVSDSYKNSHGFSIWLPSSREEYDNYKNSYADLLFNQETGWSDLLDSLN